MDLVVSMPPNPSHLEAVDPVVEGMARAAGHDGRQAGRRRSSIRTRSLPILIHGDAAFPGQGVVAETLNLSAAARLHDRRHDPHHREQPARVHDRARRTPTARRTRAAWRAGSRSRSCTSTRTIPEACIEAARLAIAYRADVQARFPDRPHRLPAPRAQRGRRAGVHAAADVPEDRRASDRARDLGADARRARRDLEATRPTR